MRFKLGIFGTNDAASYYESLTYRDTASSTSNATSYSFTGRAIGSAASNRRVIVAVTNTNDSDFADAVTIGGVSATEIGSVRLFSSSASLWIANVPTGTTATIAVSMDNTTSSCKIGWWTVNMDSSTAHDVVEATGSGSSVSGSLLIPSRGFAVAVMVATDLDVGSQNLSINQSFTAHDHGTVEGDFGSAFAEKEVSGSFSGTVTVTATNYDSAPVMVLASFKGNGA